MIKQIYFTETTTSIQENYCVLPEYHKCVLPPLTLMVGPTN